MHKIDTATAVDGEFVSGSSSTGQQATKLNAAWFNTVQRELCNIVCEAGGELSLSDDKQVVKSILLLIVSRLTSNPINGTVTLLSSDNHHKVVISPDSIELSYVDYKICADSNGLSVRFGNGKILRAGGLFKDSAGIERKGFAIVDGSGIADYFLRNDGVAALKTVNADFVNVSNNGSVTFGDGSCVDGAVKFNGCVTIDNSLIVAGTSRFQNSVTFNESISAKKNAYFNGDVQFNQPVIEKGLLPIQEEPSFSSSRTQINLDSSIFSQYSEANILCKVAYNGDEIWKLSLPETAPLGNRIRLYFTRENNSVNEGKVLHIYSDLLFSNEIFQIVSDIKTVTFVGDGTKWVYNPFI